MKDNIIDELKIPSKEEAGLMAMIGQEAVSTREIALKTNEIIRILNEK